MAGLEHREHRARLEHLRQHQENSRHGISGYILAKRIYPKSMKEGVECAKVIELQIDSSDSQFPFYKEVPDQHRQRSTGQRVCSKRAGPRNVRGRIKGHLLVSIGLDGILC